MKNDEKAEKQTTPDSTLKLLEEYAEVKAVLERLSFHMRARNGELYVSELTLLDRVARQQITLLNPMTRKLYVEFMTLMNSTMQLECKMGRRGMFMLRTRQRKLEEKRASLEAALTAAGVDFSEKEPEPDLAAAS